MLEGQHERYLCLQRSKQFYCVIKYRIKLMVILGDEIVFQKIAFALNFFNNLEIIRNLKMSTIQLDYRTNSIDEPHFSPTLR